MNKGLEKTENEQWKEAWKTTKVSVNKENEAHQKRRKMNKKEKFNCKNENMKSERKKKKKELKKEVISMQR